MIYIGAPANRFTGGPTLAHQLCFQLNQNGFEATMYYYHSKKGEEVVHERYKNLNNPYTTKFVDDKNNILVAPETAPDILKMAKKAKKVIWWMSVDNYFEKYLPSRRNKILNLGGLLKYDVFSKETYHFAQAQYAIDFLKEHNIDENKIFYLSDYVDDIFIEKVSDEININKENIVVYSPKRGLEFTEKIMTKMPDVKFVPLVNMSQPQMIDVMTRSKVYLDFGNHPGKDRIPREAALCGCCLITSKRGSAKNPVDINISDEFKFDDTDSNITAIVNLINNMLENYETYRNQYDAYRAKIYAEKERFISDAVKVFECLDKGID